MYTLRLTRSLLASFDPDPDVSPPPATTTRLGDWYVQPLRVGRRNLLLSTSGRTLLTIVLPFEALEALPQRLAVGLVGLLRDLAIPEEAMTSEIDQMADGVVRPTDSRRTLGAMRGLASIATREIGRSRRGVDVAALHLALASYRSPLNERRSAAELACELLMPAGAEQRRGKAPR